MYQFKLLTSNDLTAKSLILSLMNASNVEKLTIAHLIDSGLIFHIEATTVRVAATRLLKEGFLESKNRGIYSIGNKAKTLSSQLSQWQQITDKMCSWNNNWLIAITHHLGRTNRKQLRRSQRAFALHGFAEAETGLWVRPANLNIEIDTHRDVLIQVGAPEGTILINSTKLAYPKGIDWKNLWSLKKLNQSYRLAIDTMHKSLDALPNLSSQEAAKETLLVGQSVIQLINFDPLLPSEFGNTSLFEEMITTMTHYNKTGLEAWHKYHSETASSSS